MRITRGAYDASFAKLVSLVAYRESRRSQNQRILRDRFHWLSLSSSFFVLNIVSASLRFVWECLGMVGIILERFVNV